MTTTTPDHKKKKKEKKEKKKKRKSTDSSIKSQDTEDSNNNNSSSNKREKRQATLDSLPKVDPETGLSYTKQQLRKMRKRVERGLNPIPTKEEKEALKKQEEELRREEEEELAGNIISKKKKDDDVDSDEDDNSDDENEPQTTTCQIAKKAKTRKPVPSDYVCYACKNKIQPAHWIYDCPLKVSTGKAKAKMEKAKSTTSSTNSKSSSNRKVFVSGLPFDLNYQDLIQIFDSIGDGDNKRNHIVYAHMLKFSDSHRCKGQAFLTFDTNENMERALAMDGTMIDNRGPAAKHKKQLQLKISQFKEQ